MEKGKITTKSMSFGAFIATLGLGAFNDNAYRFFVQLLLIGAAAYLDQVRFITIAAAVFIAPFILLSAAAGILADRFPKHRVIQVTKLAELVIMVAAWYFLQLDVAWLLYLGIFLMGTQSAFFSPAKFGLLPEVLEERELSKGNGFLEMATFVAVILGTVAGSTAYQWLGRGWGGTLFVAIAAIGLAASFFVPRAPAANRQAGLRLNALRSIAHDLVEARRHKGIPFSIGWIAFFYFIGAAYQLNLILYGRAVLGLDAAATGLLMATLAIGIGCGSVAAGYLSRGRVELGLVPPGALMIALFSLDLGLAVGGSVIRAFIDTGLLGFAGGLFIVPLNATLQQRSPAAVKGRMIAFSNAVNALAILSGSLAIWLLTRTLSRDPAQLFTAFGLLAAVAFALILRVLLHAVAGFGMWLFTRLFYRTRAIGVEHVPAAGPALLVSNHLSWIDSFFIGGSLRRPVRFMLFKRFYEFPVLRPLFERLRIIPVPPPGSPKATLRALEGARAALENGHLVVIFAEGAITRTGNTGRFKSGLEVILRGTNFPIIPVRLDGLWGSIASYGMVRSLSLRPRGARRRVMVSFGAPLAAATPAFGVREAVQRLGAEAAASDRKGFETLPYRFIRTARRRFLGRFAADSGGVALSYGKGLVATIILGRRLAHSLSQDRNVGVLLPPSVGALLANLALTFAGRVPVNVNHTAPADDVDAAMRKAEVRELITSRRFLEKVPAPKGVRCILLEDLLPPRRTVVAAVLWLACLVTPTRFLGRLAVKGGPDELDSAATILFSSGSTGGPKGVVLSHFNILSNMRGLCEVLRPTGGDCIIGALPFFHALGLTATCWLPALAGLRAAYHGNPLEGKKIGELTAKHRGTILLSTPTFLLAYTRQAARDSFATLRLVIAGAESLRRPVAEAFAERFGIEPLEGYGATECSPVISLNLPERRVRGKVQTAAKRGTVGRPLPNLAVRVVDPETFAPRGAGEEGLLLVAGPSVMTGYLGDADGTQSALRDGWYVTGDIVTVDEDGFIRITGRLSRYSKIGGELVPHVRIEEAVLEAAMIGHDEAAVGSLPDPSRGERIVVYYRRGALDPQAVIVRLRENGWPNLWIPRREDFIEVDAIPLLGSGKIDYRALRGLATK